MLSMWSSVAFALKLDDSSLSTVHGWTSDGALVLELTRFDAYASPGEGEQSEDGTLRYVVVVQGDKEVARWLVGKELPAVAKIDPALQTAEWMAWRNGHPLAPATLAVNGANGVRFEVRSAESAPERKGEAFQVMAHRDDDRETFATAGLSAAGEGFWPILRQKMERGFWNGANYTTLSAYWSSDGRQVAVMVDNPNQVTMRGTVFGSLDVVLTRSAPLVGVVAPSTIAAPVTEKVAAAVRPFGAVSVSEAKAAREASVVYYAPGYEADAKSIAAKVPGGASVEPLSWTAPQHVVVAVGSSAR